MSETKLSILENVNVLLSSLFFDSRVYYLFLVLHIKDFYKIHNTTMAPYVKRLFQIDGNSPKRNPSKSPQSSPSPEFVPLGRFEGLRIPNDDYERKRYEKTTGRPLPSPKSPEMPTFGRHQYPQAANDYAEKQRYLKSTGRSLPKPESKWNIRFSKFWYTSVAIPHVK